MFICFFVRALFFVWLRLFSKGVDDKIIEIYFVKLFNKVGIWKGVDDKHFRAYCLKY
jgi:hypothetical protein